MISAEEPADAKALRIGVISTALSDRYGVRAREVAERQVEAAAGDAASPWVAVVAHLSARAAVDSTAA